MVDLYTEENVRFLLDNEIYVFAGPDWEEQQALIMEKGPQSLKDNIGSASGLPNNSLRNIGAYSQASFTKRFQQYVDHDEWFAYYNEHGQYLKTPLMDYGLVEKMQVATYTGLFDNTCPMVLTFEAIQSMGPRTVAHTVVEPWNGHVPWAFWASPWIVNDQAEQLVLN